MLNARDVAKWFIYNNPELASGYIDENTKLNKLLYFSNLMYHCVENESLVNEDFIAFPNGPVIYSIYRDYRYNGLNRMPSQSPVIDGEQEKILEIINFVYGNCSTNELVEESHTHPQWKDVEHLIPNNPIISFKNIDPNLILFYKNLYNTYADFDFDKINKEKICGNVYYYDKNSFDMTDEIIDILSMYKKFDEPKFLELIDGELVIS